MSHDAVNDLDAGLQGYDLFVYCGNNPINRIDTSGTDSLQFDNDDDTVDLDETSSSRFSPSGGQSQQSHSISTSPGHRIDTANYSGTSGRTEVHHVVEQCQSTKSGFTNSQIQADSNKVELDYNVHRAVSGHYSSIQSYSEGMRVRNWLAGKSYAFQTEYGWKVTNYYTLLRN